MSLMTGSQRETFDELARRIAPGGKLLRTWKLSGGVSAETTALEIERADARIERFLVRRHGAADLKRNPQIAADEFRLLQLLQSTAVPTPRPRYLDRGGELFGTPCLVVEYVEAESGPAALDQKTFVNQFADLLAQIHGLAFAPSDVSFLPHRDLADVPWRAADERVRKVVRSAVQLRPRNRPVLLHGDFWPGNTLWRDGRFVAIVDWEDAAVGDPLADVANARLELLWAFGSDAMDDFTRAYGHIAAGIDFTDLAYWDLWADLRLAPRIGEWALGGAAEEAMREAHETFVAQALSRLS